MRPGWAAVRWGDTARFFQEVPVTAQRYSSAVDDLIAAFRSGEMSRRQLIGRGAVLGLAAPAILAAAGESGVRAQTPAPQEEPPQLGDYEGRTLRVAVALQETEVSVFDDLIQQGFKEATGGDVERIDIEAADVVRTLQAQVPSGEVEIDIVTQDNSTLAPLVVDGLVEALPEAQDLIPAATIPSLLEVLQFDGQYYFLPARPNVQITYYNENRFNDYGVAPPKTWDELLAAGQTIQENAGIGQISIQGAPGGPVGVTVTQFLWQAGGDPLVINNEAGATAYGFMQSLQPYLTPQYQTAKFDTDNTYLLNESTILAQNWPFGVNVIVDEGGKTEIKTYSGWTGPVEEAHVLGGDVFGIVAGTQNRDMALDFARYFMSQGIQQELTSQLGWPAIREDAFGSVQDWQVPYFETIREALTKVRPRPNLAYWLEVEGILGNAFNDIVSGGAEVQSTLDRYQGEIDALVAAAGG
jgi:trehalose transport system substrate-binding protein